MKKTIFLIMFLILNKNSFSQEGKYFGDEYVCAVSHPINQYYWIDLKKDKTFEYQIFYHEKDLECKVVNGIWETKNDTLLLTSNKHQKYYYIVSTDTIKSPDNDIFLKKMTGRGNSIKNKGIDDFGLGITKMIKLEKLLNGKTGLDREWIVNSSQKYCR